jgi:hypothetical protein
MSTPLTEGLGQKLADDIQKKLKTPRNISINIQINLPVTENQKVYENFFKSLKDFLLEAESKRH